MTNSNIETNSPLVWQLDLSLPTWVNDYINLTDFPLFGIEKQMDWVIELAHKNIQHQTGGPFGAAVFTQSGELVAPGVNLVTEAGLSCAHAEVVALSMAQKRLGGFDLSAHGALTLVTSTEPCAMCLGATIWSGVTAVVSGAGGPDAEAVGFDEGPKPADWAGELEQRGIRVHSEVCKTKAVAVLQAYAKQGGEIYNGRGSNQ